MPLDLFKFPVVFRLSSRGGRSVFLDVPAFSLIQKVTQQCFQLPAFSKFSFPEAKFGFPEAKFGFPGATFGFRGATFGFREATLGVREATFGVREANFCFREAKVRS